MQKTITLEECVARLREAESEFAAAIASAVKGVMERLPQVSIHFNSRNEFGCAPDLAEKHRPDLVAIYWRTKKWRTQKKCMGRIKKEWRNYHEQR